MTYKYVFMSLDIRNNFTRVILY